MTTPGVEYFIRGPRGAERVTPTDLLWLARALVGEGGDPVTVIWALATRWIFLLQFRNLRAAFPTWTSFIRAYSQPVNPRWANQGDARTRARRARIANLQWSDIPQSIMQVIGDFFDGDLANPYPNVTDFDARASASDARRHASARSDLVYVAWVGRQGLYANPATLAWREGMVEGASRQVDFDRPPDSTPRPPPTHDSRPSPSPSSSPNATGGGAGLFFATGGALLGALLFGGKRKRRRRT